MAHKIARKDNVSGELFDLSIPSLNNYFGREHIFYTIRYGISPPLDKYLDELEGIIGGDGDDKTEKRQQRLGFLYHCFESTELQYFFELYSNYINGGGPNPHRFNDQYNNFFVLTVAGGNIITVFAQLIVNMFDSFTKAVNHQIEPADYEWEYWNLYDKDYRREQFLNDDAREIRDFMFTTEFKDWEDDSIYWTILNITYDLLTPTNKKLLDELENYDYYGTTKNDLNALQICYLICEHFLNNDKDGSVENDVRTVAEAPHSDFDFKLSPNIDPDILNERLPDYDVQPFIDELADSIPEDSDAGFMLLRAKTLIISKSFAQVPNYSPSDIQTFKNDCVSKLGTWVHSLFPQTMQQEYLQRVHKKTDCWKFLNFLMQKKILIGDATRNNVDEVLKFYMSGYHQAEDRNGRTEDRNGRRYHPIPIQPNSTEAIIAYLYNVTYHLNIYIHNWENDTLSIYSAPALFMNGRKVVKPKDYSYKNICFSFLSLNTILDSNNSFIARLGTDILNYFLNNPVFETEAILDSLIKTVNNQKKIYDPRSSAYMPPSDLILVPTHPNFSRSLRTIKDILQNSRYSELGYPDGLRLTINAIKTNSDIKPELPQLPDTRLDETTDKAIDIAQSDSRIMSGFVQFKSKGAPGTSSSDMDVSDAEGKKTKKKKKSKKMKKKSKKMKKKLKKAIKNIILLNRSIKLLKENTKGKTSKKYKKKKQKTKNKKIKKKLN
jgi:hypothetical protein